MIPDNLSPVIADADPVNPTFTVGWFDYAQPAGSSPTRPGCATPPTSLGSSEWWLEGAVRARLTSGGASPLGPHCG